VKVTRQVFPDCVTVATRVPEVVLVQFPLPIAWADEIGVSKASAIAKTSDMRWLRFTGLL
jgi:hypothetical protein